MEKIENSVGNRSVCYGCGMCVTICPTNVLSMRLDENGFYTPRLASPEACTGCGLCSRICNYSKSEQAQFKFPIDSLAAWSNNDEVRNLCSSGGIAFEIIHKLVEMDYNICGVRYNPNNQTVEHYITNKPKDLLQSCGSKYLQSNTSKAFSEIDLNKKNVIIGTPCQIDMWRRYLRLRKKEENFILVDFFCHGVPSYLVWQKYLLENRSNINRNSMITWRDKNSGWHSSWNICAYDNNDFWNKNPYFRSSSKKDKDGFYFMFLSNCALNLACYSECKYKKYNSSADIRLGDYWGDEYATNEKGVSAVLAFTDRGTEVLAKLEISTKQVSPEILTKAQISKPIKKPWYYTLCRLAIKTNYMTIKNIRKLFVISEISMFQLKKIKHLWS